MRTRTHLYWGLSVACAWTVTATTPAAADGKLSRAREETRGSGGDSNSRSRDSRKEPEHHHHRRAHSHHSDSSHDQSLGDAVVCAIFPCSGDSSETYYEADTYVVAGPPEPQRTYASYPYANASSPYLLEPVLEVASTSTTLDAQLLAEHTPGRPWAGQVSLDAGFMSGIGQNSLDLRVLMPGRFELSARNTLLWEPAARDYSLLGSAVVGLRFLQTPAALMRLTAGLSYFGHLLHAEPGAELGMGMDLFLGRPWILSASASAALIGQTVVPQARIQLGYLFGRSEVFFGYQYLQVGSVSLSTPLLGTRIWL